MTANIFRIPITSPDDTSGLRALIDQGKVVPEDIVAVLGKTEGNGCVNDFSRGFTTFAYQVFLAKALRISENEVKERIAFVMSGGTEGVLSPHVCVFTKNKNNATAVPSHGPKRFTIGTSKTREFLPEEIGKMAQVEAVADAVAQAMADADIDSIEDVHFVQIKCPLLTADRVKSAQERGAKTVTADTYESMGWSRAASALGVALKLEEVPVEHLNDDIINEDWSIFSSVASTSAGIELMNCEVMVLGNSASSLSDLVIAHSVMQDAIDGEAVREALSQAGVDVSTAATDIRQSGRIVQVLAKAEADPSGEVRGSRHTMLEDSDINNTRMARAVVAAVIASINGDTLNYVSGGAEHQGPAGGGPIAVIAQA